MTVQPSALALDNFTTFGDLLKYLRRRAGLTRARAIYRRRLQRCANQPS